MCRKPGHSAKDCPSTSAPSDQTRVTTRFFAITKEEVIADLSVVSGKLTDHGIIVHALIDSGAMHSFASPTCMRQLGRPFESLSYEYSVTTPSGEVMCSNQIMRDCPIRIEGRDLMVDLVILDLQDFDLILGMDWLSKHHATINCHEKTVSFNCLEMVSWFLRVKSRRSLFQLFQQ